MISATLPRGHLPLAPPAPIAELLALAAVSTGTSSRWCGARRGGRARRPGAAWSLPDRRRVKVGGRSSGGTRPSPPDQRAARPAATVHLAVANRGESRNGNTRVHRSRVRPGPGVDSYLAFHAVGGARWEHASGVCPEDRLLSSSWTLPRSGDAWAGGFLRSTPGSRAPPPVPLERARNALGQHRRINPSPAIEYAPLDEPWPILQWIDGVRREGRTPHLHTHCSSAVHLCQRGGGRRDAARWGATHRRQRADTAARLATSGGPAPRAGLSMRASRPVWSGVRVSTPRRPMRCTCTRTARADPARRRGCPAWLDGRRPVDHLAAGRRPPRWSS